MTYRVIKIDSNTEQEFNLGGGYTEADVKAVVKGYTFNGLFWDRKGSKWMYIVEPEQ